MPGVCRCRPALRILPHGEIRDGSGSFWETRSVGAVVLGATPGGGAECGSGSRRVSPGRGRALPGPVAGYWALLTGNRGPRRPSRGPRRRRLSKSAAKARIAPERRRRIVDIPRFFSRPTPVRGAFATDSDTPPPRAAPGAPPAPHRARPAPPRCRTSDPPGTARPTPTAHPGAEDATPSPSTGLSGALAGGMRRPLTCSGTAPGESRDRRRQRGTRADAHR